MTQLANFLLLLPTLSAAGVATTLPAAHEAVYVSAEYTLEVRVSEKTWTVGPILASASLPSEVGSNPFSESVGHAVNDCSDAIFRCLESWGRTLAVPRAGLVAGGTYRKNGVNFHVETCIRGDKTKCQVGLISAKCEERGDDQVCRSGTSAPPRKFEYIEYFHTRRILESQPWVSRITLHLHLQASGWLPCS